MRHCASAAIPIPPPVPTRGSPRPARVATSAHHPPAGSRDLVTESPPSPPGEESRPYTRVPAVTGVPEHFLCLARPLTKTLSRRLPVRLFPRAPSRTFRRSGVPGDFRFHNMDNAPRSKPLSFPSATTRPCSHLYDTATTRLAASPSNLTRATRREPPNMWRANAPGCGKEEGETRSPTTESGWESSVSAPPAPLAETDFPRTRVRNSSAAIGSRRGNPAALHSLC